MLCLDDIHKLPSGEDRDTWSSFSDGGGLLLREVERKINLLVRLARCFVDGRSPLLVEPSA